MPGGITAPPTSRALNRRFVRSAEKRIAPVNASTVARETAASCGRVTGQTPLPFAMLPCVSEPEASGL